MSARIGDDDFVAGRRVLLVLAERSLGDAVALRLALRGAHVRFVSSTNEALRVYEAFRPDVVVTEVLSRASTLALGIGGLLGKEVLAAALGDVVRDDRRLAV